MKCRLDAAGVEKDKKLKEGTQENVKRTLGGGRTGKAEKTRARGEIQSTCWPFMLSVLEYTERSPE